MPNDSNMDTVLNLIGTVRDDIKELATSVDKQADRVRVLEKDVSRTEGERGRHEGLHDQVLALNTRMGTLEVQHAAQAVQMQMASKSVAWVAGIVGGILSAGGAALIEGLGLV